MMAFTGDGAADPRMVAKRDAQYGTNSAERKAHREQALDFSHQPSKAADHWMQGKGAYQLELNKTDFKSGMPLLNLTVLLAAMHEDGYVHDGMGCLH